MGWAAEEGDITGRGWGVLQRATGGRECKGPGGGPWAPGSHRGPWSKMGGGARPLELGQGCRQGAQGHPTLPQTAPAHFASCPWPGAQKGTRTRGRMSIPGPSLALQMLCPHLGKGTVPRWGSPPSSCCDGGRQPGSRHVRRQGRGREGKSLAQGSVTAVGSSCLIPRNPVPQPWHCWCLSSREAGACG